MISVEVPTILRTYTNDERVVNAEGANLAEVVESLESRFPGIAQRLIEDGQLRRFVNVYINDEDVRFIDGLASPVQDDDTVTILPAVAGG